MTNLSRRSINSLLAMGAAGATLTPLTNAFAKKQGGSCGGDEEFSGFGELTPRLPKNSTSLPPELQDIEFITLPRHFEYSVISTTGEMMDDGNTVAGAHDGMACFEARGGHTVLVRNHELVTSSNPVIAPDESTYNPAMAGGTSTLVLDSRGRLVSHRNSLGGTERNCAGGPTPWNSWLTCEETFSTRDGMPHGYVFDVPAFGMGNREPLRGLGRFSHEAAAIDPRTGYVYLTEDRGDSVLYRFRPAAYGDLRSPGQLEALRLVDWAGGINTRSGFLPFLGTPLDADWVPVDDFDPVNDTCRQEAQVQGAAIFSRGEGCWYADGVIYFCSTNGGDQGLGQIFAYDPSCDKVTLFIESTDPAILEAPDNICVGPKGRLYMFEDGGGEQNIVGATRDGELFIVSNNIYNDSEFAGGCFSRNGRFLFVNVQTPGLTLVIEGPWDSGRR